MEKNRLQWEGVGRQTILSKSMFRGSQCPQYTFCERWNFSKVIICMFLFKISKSFSKFPKDFSKFHYYLSVEILSEFTLRALEFLKMHVERN